MNIYGFVQSTSVVTSISLVSGATAFHENEGLGFRQKILSFHVILFWIGLVTSDDSIFFLLRNLCRSQGFPSRRCWKRMRTNWWTPRPVTRTAVYGGPQWFGFRTWTAPKHDSNQKWVDLEATLFSLSIWWNYCCICMTKMTAVFDGWMTCWDPFLEAELKPIRVRFLQARLGCYFFETVKTGWTTPWL